MCASWQVVPHGSLAPHEHLFERARQPFVPKLGCPPISLIDDDVSLLYYQLKAPKV